MSCASSRVAFDCAPVSPSIRGSIASSILSGAPSWLALVKTSLAACRTARSKAMGVGAFAGVAGVCATATAGNSATAASTAQAASRPRAAAKSEAIGSSWCSLTRMSRLRGPRPADAPIGTCAGLASNYASTRRKSVTNETAPARPRRRRCLSRPAALGSSRPTGDPMRMFAASLATETNTFSPIPTSRRSFEDRSMRPPASTPTSPSCARRRSMSRAGGRRRRASR